MRRDCQRQDAQLRTPGVHLAPSPNLPHPQQGGAKLGTMGAPCRRCGGPRSAPVAAVRPSPSAPERPVSTAVSSATTASPSTASPARFSPAMVSATPLANPREAPGARRVSRPGCVPELEAGGTTAGTRTPPGTPVEYLAGVLL